MCNELAKEHFTVLALSLRYHNRTAAQRNRSKAIGTLWDFPQGIGNGPVVLWKTLFFNGLSVLKQGQCSLA